MKLKYERFEGMGCFYVRGMVDASQIKLLAIGLETIAAKLEETLLVHVGHAKLNPQVTPLLIQFKKKLAGLTTQKIHWICTEKGLGDFNTLDFFFSRLTGVKFRQVGERIRLDDQISIASETIKELEAKLQEVGGDAQNAHRLILEANMLKEQKRIITECVKFQDLRIRLQEKIPSDDKELPQKITDTLDALKKAGIEADL